MGKITKKALYKIGAIVEIIMELLSCEYTQAWILVVSTSVGKAIIEGDSATMYQSAPCCVEDIAREFKQMNHQYASYFTNEKINKSIDNIRQRNKINMQRYKQLVG